MLRRRSLAGRLRSRQSWNELEIADEVDAAHGRGMIHRDTKLGNIFVAEHRVAQILDFGLSRAIR